MTHSSPKQPRADTSNRNRSPNEDQTVVMFEAPWGDVFRRRFNLAEQDAVQRLLLKDAGNAKVLEQGSDIPTKVLSCFGAEYYFFDFREFGRIVVCRIVFDGEENTTDWLDSDWFATAKKAALGAVISQVAKKAWEILRETMLIQTQPYSYSAFLLDDYIVQAGYARLEDVNPADTYVLYILMSEALGISLGGCFRMFGMSRLCLVWATCVSRSSRLGDSGRGLAVRLRQSRSAKSGLIVDWRNALQRRHRSADIDSSCPMIGTNDAAALGFTPAAAAPTQVLTNVEIGRTVTPRRSVITASHGFGAAVGSSAIALTNVEVGSTVAARRASNAAVTNAAAALRFAPAAAAPTRVLVGVVSGSTVAPRRASNAAVTNAAALLCLTSAAAAPTRVLVGVVPESAVALSRSFSTAVTNAAAALRFAPAAAAPTRVLVGVVSGSTVAPRRASNAAVTNAAAALDVRMGLAAPTPAVAARKCDLGIHGSIAMSICSPEVHEAYSDCPAARYWARLESEYRNQSGRESLVSIGPFPSEKESARRVRKGVAARCFGIVRHTRMFGASLPSGSNAVGGSNGNV